MTTGRLVERSFGGTRGQDEGLERDFMLRVAACTGGKFADRKIGLPKPSDLLRKVTKEFKFF